jgi:hypothetical protein
MSTHSPDESTLPFEIPRFGDVPLEVTDKHGKGSVHTVKRLARSDLAFGDGWLAHNLLHFTQRFVSASPAEAAKERHLRQPRSILHEV